MAEVGRAEAIWSTFILVQIEKVRAAAQPRSYVGRGGGGEVVLAELVPGWAMLVSPPSS